MPRVSVLLTLLPKPRKWCKKIAVNTVTHFHNIDFFQSLARYFVFKTELSLIQPSKENRNKRSVGEACPIGPCDESARSDARSGEDAVGGLTASEGELRISGMHDSQEAEYPAKPSLAFYTAMAKPEGDE